MATYRDAALAEYQWRLDQEAAQVQQAEDALVADARNAIGPLITDHTSKVVLTADKWTPDLVDTEAGLVVLTATDGAGVSFAVYPNQVPVERYLAELVDGQWQRGAAVKDMDDVGEQLSGGGA